MKRTVRFRTVLIAAALAALALPAAVLAAGQVGEAAADFTLNTPTGAGHSLSDYDGKVRLLTMIGWG